MISSLFLTHCISSPAPVKDFTVAERALERAERAGAQKFYPESHLKAKRLYNKALAFYKQGKHPQAKNYFEKSILLSERAELKSLYRQKKELE